MECETIFFFRISHQVKSLIDEAYQGNFVIIAKRYELFFVIIILKIVNFRKLQINKNIKMINHPSIIHDKKKIKNIQSISQYQIAILSSKFKFFPLSLSLTPFIERRKFNSFQFSFMQAEHLRKKERRRSFELN